MYICLISVETRTALISQHKFVLVWPPHWLTACLPARRPKCALMQQNTFVPQERPQPSTQTHTDVNIYSGIAISSLSTDSSFVLAPLHFYPAPLYNSAAY